MDCLTGEYDNDSENDLEHMIGQIKTYDSFVAEVEAIRQIKPVRDNQAHRLVRVENQVQNLFGSNLVENQVQNIFGSDFNILRP